MKDSRKITLCCEGLPWLFFAALSYLVLSQATNIPFWDEWGAATLFDRYYSGTLTLKYVVLSQRDHFLVIPHMIVLFLGSVTQWDLRLELIINLGLGAGIYLLYRSVLLTHATKNRNNSILLPVTSIFVFSFIQWHNWIWGWQMQIFISIFAALASLAVLTLKEINTKNIFIAAVYAVISNFSFASGTSLWLIGALLIALRANRFNLYLVWSIPAIICLAIYYFISPKGLILNSIHLVANVEYIITYIGFPVSIWGENATFYVGVFGIGLLGIYLFFNRTFDGYALFFLSVIAFVIITAALTSIARRHDFDDANISRYASFSVHYWISIICLLFNFSRTQKFFINLPKYAAILMITFFSITTSYKSIHRFYVKDERTMVINYLLNPQVVPEEQVNFGSVIWNRDFLNEQTALLKKYRLAFYADP